MAEAKAMWYLPGRDGQSTGPFTRDELQRRYRAGEIQPTTLCWTEGMSDWQPWADLEASVISSGMTVSSPVAAEAAPSPAAAEPGGKWYLPGDGPDPSGPYTDRQVAEWLRAGRLSWQNLCWCEGLGDWRPLAEIGEFQETIRKLEETARRRRRRAGLVVGVLSCLAIAGGIGWYLFVGPPEVRQGRDLIEAGLYHEASEVLMPFVRAHPLDDRAVYLLAVAKTNEYAADRESGGLFVLSGQNAGLKEAGELFRRAFTADASWMDEAKSDLVKASGRIPQKVPDRMTRILSLCRLRADLKLASPHSLAREVLAALNDRGESGPPGLPDRTALLQILTWDSSLVRETAELVLNSGSGSAGELEAAVGTLSYLAKALSTLNDALPAILLGRAEVLVAEGKYDVAESLLAAAATLAKPDALAGVARQRIRCLEKRLAGGDAAGMVSILERTYRESPAMQAGAAALYRDAAIALRSDNPEVARKALQRLIELNPKAGEDEEVALLQLELVAQPGDTKLAGLQAFLKDHPKSVHREEVLLMVVRETSAVMRRGFGVSRDQAKRLAEAGIAAAGSLLKVQPRPEVLEESLFGIAEALERAGEWERAVELGLLLLDSDPQAVSRTRLTEAIAKWRRHGEREQSQPHLPGPSPPPPKPPPKEKEKPPEPRVVNTKKELKTTLATLQSQRVIWIRLAKAKLKEQEVATLQKWVKDDGGVLWIENDLAESFWLKSWLQRGEKAAVPSEGVAKISTMHHPVVQRFARGCAGQEVDYSLSSSVSIKPPPKGVAGKEGYPKPLLEVGDRYLWVIKEAQSGWVVFRPGSIVADTEAARLLEENLAAVSYELANESRDKEPAGPNGPRRPARRRP